MCNRIAARGGLQLARLAHAGAGPNFRSDRVAGEHLVSPDAGGCGVAGRISRPRLVGFSGAVRTRCAVAAQHGEN